MLDAVEHRNRHFNQIDVANQCSRYNNHSENDCDGGKRKPKQLILHSCPIRLATSENSTTSPTVSIGRSYISTPPSFRAASPKTPGVNRGALRNWYTRPKSSRSPRPLTSRREPGGYHHRQGL